VSEYQYYEFLALDKPLTDEQRAELRKLSSRAEITATRFVNEYNYGDFRGNRRARPSFRYCPTRERRQNALMVTPWLLRSIGSSHGGHRCGEGPEQGPGPPGP